MISQCRDCGELVIWAESAFGHTAFDVKGATTEADVAKRRFELIRGDGCVPEAQPPRYMGKQTYRQHTCAGAQK